MKGILMSFGLFGFFECFAFLGCGSVNTLTEQVIRRTARAKLIMNEYNFCLKRMALKMKQVMSMAFTLTCFLNGNRKILLRL